MIVVLIAATFALGFLTGAYTLRRKPQSHQPVRAPREVNGSRGLSAFGPNVRAARKSAGLTQRQLADAIGVDSITVSRWERGASKPEEPHLMRLLDHFDRDLASFYTDQEAAA